MAAIVMNSAPKRKRVSFAFDEPDFLFKPKPTKGRYMRLIRKAYRRGENREEIEEEELA